MEYTYFSKLLAKDFPLMIGDKNDPDNQEEDAVERELQFLDQIFQPNFLEFEDSVLYSFKHHQFKILNNNYQQIRIINIRFDNSQFSIFDQNLKEILQTPLNKQQREKNIKIVFVPTTLGRILSHIFFEIEISGLQSTPETKYRTLVYEIKAKVVENQFQMKNINLELDFDSKQTHAVEIFNPHKKKLTIESLNSNNKLFTIQTYVEAYDKIGSKQSEFGEYEVNIQDLESHNWEIGFGETKIIAQLNFKTVKEGEYFDKLNIRLLGSQIYSIPVYYRVLRNGLNPLQKFLDFGLIIYGIQSQVLNKLILLNTSDEPVEIEDVLIEFDKIDYPCFQLNQQSENEDDEDNIIVAENSYNSHIVGDTVFAQGMFSSNPAINSAGSYSEVISIPPHDKRTIGSLTFFGALNALEGMYSGRIIVKIASPPNLRTNAPISSQQIPNSLDVEFDFQLFYLKYENYFDDSQSVQLPVKPSTTGGGSNTSGSGKSHHSGSSGKNSIKTTVHLATNFLHNFLVKEVLNQSPDTIMIENNSLLHNKVFLLGNQTKSGIYSTIGDQNDHQKTGTSSYPNSFDITFYHLQEQQSYQKSGIYNEYILFKLQSNIYYPFKIQVYDLGLHCQIESFLNLFKCSEFNSPKKGGSGAIGSNPNYPNLNVDFGIVGLNENRNQTLQLFNMNPFDIQIYSIEVKSQGIKIDYAQKSSNSQQNSPSTNASITTGQEIQSGKVSKEPLIVLHPGSNFVFNIMLQTNQQFEESSASISIETETETIDIKSKYKIVSGSLETNQSRIQFYQAFPGQIDQKLVKFHNQFEVPITFLNFSCQDSRLKVEIIKPVLLPDEATDVFAVILDPSNSHPRVNYAQTDSKNIETLTQRDISIWKENLQIWEEIQSDITKKHIDTVIMIQTDIIQNFTLHIKADLTQPKILLEEQIDFGLNQVGDNVQRNITLINPTSYPIAYQLYVSQRNFYDNSYIKYLLQDFLEQEELNQYIPLNWPFSQRHNNQQQYQNLFICMPEELKYHSKFNYFFSKLYDIFLEKTNLIELSITKNSRNSYRLIYVIKRD